MGRLCILVVPLIALILQSSGSTNVNDVDENTHSKRESQPLRDEVTDELEKQIDFLRNQIKKLKTQLDTTTSMENANGLHKELADLRTKLETNYKRIDYLSKDLKQQFRQKFDSLNKELISVSDVLWNKVTNLEDKIQNNLILQIIGSIQDDKINTAAKSFLGVDYHNLVIPRIVKEAYKVKDPKICKNILKFVDTIEIIHERPQALDVLFELVKTQGIFSNSDCVLGIAYQTRMLLKKRIRSGPPLAYLWGIQRDLPFSAHMLNTYSGYLYLSKEMTECKFKSQDERNNYAYKDYLGDMTKWRVLPEVGEHEGEFYRFQDRSSNEILETDKDGRVYRGLDYNNGPKQHWKPILKSNEQIALQNRETGKYLGFEDVGSCYKYKMSDTATNVFIRN